MKKEFCVQVDVTMSGNVYVKASSKEEAERIAREMDFVGSDLTSFYWLGTEVVDVEEE